MNNYERRVEELEAEGMSRSDAQSVADLEALRKAAPLLYRELRQLAMLAKTSPDLTIGEVVGENEVIKEVLRAAAGAE